MIRIRLLGGTSVRVGRTKVQPASAVQFALTVFLATTAGTPVVRSRLLELFWPRMDAEGARHALRQMLYRLRRAGLGLEESGESLVLARDAVEADFLAVLEPGWGESASDADVAGAARFLEDVPLPALPDFREWADALRARITAAARRVLLERIAKARLEGRWSRVEDLARLCLAIDPLNEQATLARAEAFAMSGAKSTALRTLDAYVDDLGDQAREIALPARVLRERIAENFSFIRNVPQAWQRYVGRSAELARCHAVIDEAVAGTGATVVVSGPSGIGKTRLAQEVLAVAKLRGVATTAVRLESRDSERALSLFTELVPELLRLPGAAACEPDSMRLLQLFTHARDPDRAEKIATDAPAMRERIRRAIIDVLESIADEAPIIALIDDAGNIDGASLALFRAVAGSHAGRRVVWLLAGEGLERANWLPTLPSTPVVIRLGGLPLDDCSRLASTFLLAPPTAQEVEALRMCFDATRGNPLFVKEWMREWRGTGEIPSVPDPIREAIQKRIRSLSEEGRRTLQTCCLLGPLATPSLLAELLAVDLPATVSLIEELDSADLLASNPSNPLEIHEQTAGVARELMSAAHAHLLHYRIGESLETRALQTWSSRLAWGASEHLIAAGEQARGVRLLRQCANHLLNNGEVLEAAECFDRSLMAATEPEERAQLILEQALCLLRAGHLERASEIAERGLRESGPGTDLAGYRRSLEAVQLECRWPRAESLHEPLSQALRLLSEPGITRTHAANIARIACVIAGNLDDRASLSLIRNAVERLFVDDSTASSDLYSVRAMLAFADGDYQRTIDFFMKSIMIDLNTGIIGARVKSLLNVSFALRHVGRLDECYARLRECFDLSAEYGIAADAAAAADRLSALHLDREEESESLGWLRLAQEWASRTDDRAIQRSVANQAMRFDARYHKLGISPADVQQHYETALHSLPERRALEDMATVVAWMDALSEPSRFPEALKHLIAGLDRRNAALWSDYSVAAAAAGLIDSGEPGKARSYLERRIASTGPSERVPAILSHALARANAL